MFSFSFSPEWRADAELVQAKQFAVSMKHVEVLRAAAKILRTQFSSRQETVSGRVVRLASEGDPSDLLNPMGERQIAVQWSSEDLGEIHVRVALSAFDYLCADLLVLPGARFRLECLQHRRPASGSA